MSALHISKKDLVVLKAVRSKGDNTYVLNGVHVAEYADHGTYLIATDTHRLVAIFCPSDGVYEYREMPTGRKPDNEYTTQWPTFEAFVKSARKDTQKRHVVYTEDIAKLPRIDMPYPRFVEVVPSPDLGEVAFTLNRETDSFHGSAFVDMGHVLDFLRYIDYKTEFRQESAMNETVYHARHDNAALLLMPIQVKK